MAALHIFTLASLVYMVSAGMGMVTPLAKPTLEISGQLAESTNSVTYVRIGTKFNIDCKAAASEESAVGSRQWMKDGTAIGGETSMRLTIDPLAWTDSGSFTCILKASGGANTDSPSSAPMVVKAGGPPLASALAITSLNCTHVTITWSKPTPADSFENYEVELTPKAPFTVPSKEAAEPSSVLGKLEPDTAYTLTVNTLTAIGDVKIRSIDFQKTFTVTGAGDKRHASVVVFCIAMIASAIMANLA